MHYGRGLQRGVVQLPNLYLLRSNCFRFCATILLIALPEINIAQAQSESPAASDAASTISKLSCNVFTEQAWKENRWREGDRTRSASTPFGVPYLEWSNREFNALKRRARECGDPVIDMVQATQRIDGEQQANALRIENLRRDRDTLNQYRDRVFGELSSISHIGSAEDQVKKIEKLRQESRGRSREIDEKVQAALEAAQDRRVEEVATRERDAKLRAAEQEVENAKRAV